VIEIRRYVTRSERDVFGEWFSGLRDSSARAKIAVRLDRLALGNFGDCKPLREGVWELRIDCGPGYRVYYGMVGKECILLLCGGDKRKQTADIARAAEYLSDYRNRVSGQ
jgi:putative addiction module killer protein